MRLRNSWSVLLLGATIAGAAEPANRAVTPANPPANTVQTPTLDDLFQTGQALFDAYAPEEIKAQYDFPNREQWDLFAAQLQQVLESEDLPALADYEPEARLALQGLRSFPGYEEYADWLEERLDYIEAAKQTLERPVPQPPVTKPSPQRPPPFIPHLDLWLQRMGNRPEPANAKTLMPLLRRVFIAEGIPGELAWLAEAESTFNPMARSPVGARGLFQLMPPTAKELGLSTFLPDERIDPEKSARAAAQYLRKLHTQFNDWPLAIAAYNAGPGRIQRTLTKQSAKTFAEIAAVLPSETRMYVPKVLATLQVRSGLTLSQLSR